VTPVAAWHVVEWPAIPDWCPLPDSLRAEALDVLATEVERLRTALVEIAKGEGRFNRDPLEHASNAVWDMQQLAKAALEAK
jgi:hypothetical protein